MFTHTAAKQKGVPLRRRKPACHYRAAGAESTAAPAVVSHVGIKVCEGVLKKHGRPTAGQSRVSPGLGGGGRGGGGRVSTGRAL